MPPALRDKDRRARPSAEAAGVGLATESVVGGIHAAGCPWERRWGGAEEQEAQRAAGVGEIQRAVVVRIRRLLAERFLADSREAPS